MSIYDKPVYRLMHDFASDRLKPNSVFSKQDAIEWFETHYPKIRRNTVTKHVEGMATNNGSHRKHHPKIRPGRDGMELSSRRVETDSDYGARTPPGARVRDTTEIGVRIAKMSPRLR